MLKSVSREKYPTIEGPLFWFYTADLIIGLQVTVGEALILLKNKGPVWARRMVGLKGGTVNLFHPLGLTTLEQILIRDGAEFILACLYSIRADRFKKEAKGVDEPK
jgi:hypothetical protein